MQPLNFHQISTLLEETSLLTGLSEAELMGLARGARHRRFASGESIYLKGSEGTSVFFVVEGRVRATTTGRAGNELLLSMIEQGRIFGELGLADQGPRMVDTVANAATYLIEMDGAVLAPIVFGHPESARAYSRILVGHLREVVGNLESMAFHGAQRRLWFRLMYLRNRYRGVESGTSRIRIEHGLSQQDLANSIGLTRVMVNRQLSLWRQAGLIEDARGVIEIKDAAALESYVWREDSSGDSNSEP